MQHSRQGPPRARTPSPTSPRSDSEEPEPTPSRADRETVGEIARPELDLPEHDPEQPSAEQDRPLAATFAAAPDQRAIGQRDIGPEQFAAGSAGGDNPRLVQVGTVGVTPINVDMRFLYPATLVKVQLSAAYNTVGVPGYPARPAFTGVDHGNLHHTKTVASGTTLTLLKPEADALVAAGAGTVVP